MIYTSIKQLKAAATHLFKDLSITEKKKIAKMPINEIACNCKFGYTHGALFETSLGLVFCYGYNEYCQMLAIKHNMEVR